MLDSVKTAAYAAAVVCRMMTDSADDGDSVYDNDAPMTVTAPVTVRALQLLSGPSELYLIDVRSSTYV